MSSVESVALWAGLIVGIASVVLAVVAIYFSIEVDRRSERTSSSTIRALERIESTVEGQSRDTRELIKVAWERMLGNINGSESTSTPDADGAREIAAGIAAELRASLFPNDTDLPGENLADASETIEEIRETVESQLRAARSRPGDEIQFWIDKITGLSEDAQTVLRALMHSHITAEQFRTLQEDRDGIGDEMQELRRAGFLVPLEGYNHKSKRTLVYWLPPSKARHIQAALLMFPAPENDYADFVELLLADAGYPDSPATKPSVES